MNINAYIHAFEQLSASTLNSDLMPLFSENARFKDPFNDVTGANEIQRVFEHMFATTTNPRFHVHHHAITDDIAYLEWTFTTHIGKLKREFVVPGMSKVTFDTNGKVCEHIDYWDPAEHLFTHFPVIGALMRWLRRKLTAK